MSDDPVRQLIRSLAEDLEPVQPIPPLRRVAGCVLGVWLAVAAGAALLRGLRPEAVAAVLASTGMAAVFVALGAAGVAGLLCALALGVPGREPLARGSLLVGLAALAAAAGIGTLLLWLHPAAAAAPFAPRDLTCLGTASALAALPALAAVVFAARAAAFRPVAVVLAAASGAASLGAVAAQASCPHGDALHLLVGHVLAPVAGALLLTLPLWAVLARLARQSNRRPLG